MPDGNINEGTGLGGDLEATVWEKHVNEWCLSRAWKALFIQHGWENWHLGGGDRKDRRKGNDATIIQLAAWYVREGSGGGQDFGEFIRAVPEEARCSLRARIKSRFFRRTNDYPRPRPLMSEFFLDIQNHHVSQNLNVANKGRHLKWAMHH